MALRETTDPGQIKLRDVQETLLTPLCARSDQWGRSDAIVTDRCAKQLVEAIDYDFDKIRQFPNTLTGCAIRAAIMDGWVSDFLSDHPSGAICLLGVGLDTVFERNDLSGSATWFECDFPDVMQLRERCFAPSPRRHAIAGDLLDFSWIQRVKAHSDGPWLFQAAGLLLYLPPEKVRLLFTKLADNFPGCTFLFDGCSNYALENSKRWEATISTTDASFQWAIDAPGDIAQWDPRITVADVEYMMDHHRHQWKLSTRFWSRLSSKLRKAYHINRAFFDPNVA